VSFRLLPSRSGRSERGRAGEPFRFFPATPLALRLEALIRLAEDPTRHAARLARRLRDQPATIPRLLRPIAPGRPALPREEVAEAQARARATVGRLAPHTG
jgi:hypothetical protein